MSIPAFAIGEWMTCPYCDFLADAPFHPPGCTVEEPELVLGSTLPQAVTVPDGEWRTTVSAACPECSRELCAEVVFRGHRLYAFTPVTTV